MGMAETIVATVLGGLILTAIIWAGSHLYEASRQNRFRCTFVDHDPPNSTEVPLGNFYEIHLGTGLHWLKLVTADGLPLDEVNIRFISNEEAAKDPTHGNPENIKSIVSIKTCTVTPEILGQRIEVIPSGDRHGGIDMKFIPSYPWGSGRALFIRIEVEAKKLWSGKISARINDKDLRQRLARADVRIRD